MLNLKDKTIQSTHQAQNWPDFNEQFFEMIRHDPFFERKAQESAERLSKLKEPLIWDKARS